MAEIDLVRTSCCWRAENTSPVAKKAHLPEPDGHGYTDLNLRLPDQDLFVSKFESIHLSQSEKFSLPIKANNVEG